MARTSDQERWLDATTALQPHPSARDRSRGWLQQQRRERARKSLKRRLKKSFQLLWDIETRLVAQGLAFTLMHQTLTTAIEDLKAFQDRYDRSSVRRK